MNKPTTIYFVWVTGLKGPVGEIYYGLDQNKDSHNRNKKEILQEHPLPDEYRDLSIKQLELIFPYTGAK